MEFANRLGGLVALVTGGSRGIGAEIVRRLAAEGADVGFTYHTGRDEAQQVATQVRALGRRVLTVQADLGEPAAAGAVVEAVVGEFGRLDILVNNAGITHWGALAQTRLEDFDRLVAVDARAPFLMMQAAADTLTDGGRVVNVSSGVTNTALAGIALYSGVKAFPTRSRKSPRWNSPPAGSRSTRWRRAARRPVPSRSCRPGSGRRRGPRSPSAGSGRRRTRPASSRSSPRPTPVSSPARSSATQAASAAPSAGPVFQDYQRLAARKYGRPERRLRVRRLGRDQRPGQASEGGGVQESAGDVPGHPLALEV